MVQAEDELAAWLGNVDLDDEHDHNHHTHEYRHRHKHRTRRANAPEEADGGTRGYELYR